VRAHLPDHQYRENEYREVSADYDRPNRREQKKRKTSMERLNNRNFTESTIFPMKNVPHTHTRARDT